MKTATILNKDMGNDNQWLVKVSPPHDGHEFIVVSVGKSGFNETYLFGANEDGIITNWMELSGSQVGFRDHRRVLCEAGFIISED